MMTKLKFLVNYPFKGRFTQKHVLTLMLLKTCTTFHLEDVFFFFGVNCHLNSESLVLVVRDKCRPERLS